MISWFVLPYVITAMELGHILFNFTSVGAEVSSQCQDIRTKTFADKANIPLCWEVNIVADFYFPNVDAVTKVHNMMSSQVPDHP